MPRPPARGDEHADDLVEQFGVAVVAGVRRVERPPVRGGGGVEVAERVPRAARALGGERGEVLVAALHRALPRLGGARVVARVAAQRAEVDGGLLHPVGVPALDHQGQRGVGGGVRARAPPRVRGLQREPGGHRRTGVVAALPDGGERGRGAVEVGGDQPPRERAVLGQLRMVLADQRERGARGVEVVQADAGEAEQPGAARRPEPVAARRDPFVDGRRARQVAAPLQHAEHARLGLRAEARVARRGHRLVRLQRRVLVAVRAAPFERRAERLRHPRREGREAVRAGPAQQRDHLVGVVLAPQHPRQDGRVRQRHRVARARRLLQQRDPARTGRAERDAHLREHALGERGDGGIGVRGALLVAGDARLAAVPLVLDERAEQRVRLRPGGARRIGRTGGGEEVEADGGAEAVHEVGAVRDVLQQLGGLLGVALAEFEGGEHRRGARRLDGDVRVGHRAQQRAGRVRLAVADPFEGGVAVVQGALVRLVRSALGGLGLGERHRRLERHVRVVQLGGPAQQAEGLGSMGVAVRQLLQEHAEEVHGAPVEVAVGGEHLAPARERVVHPSRLGVELPEARPRLGGEARVARLHDPPQDRVRLPLVTEPVGELGLLDERVQPHLRPVVLGGPPVRLARLGVLTEVEQRRAEQLLGHPALGRVADRDRVLADAAALGELAALGVDRVEPERGARAQRGDAVREHPVQPGEDHLVVGVRAVVGLVLVEQAGDGFVGVPRLALALAAVVRRAGHGQALGQPGDLRQLGPPGPVQRRGGPVGVAERAEHPDEHDVGHRGGHRVGAGGGGPQRAARERPLAGVHEQRAEAERGARREHRVAGRDDRAVRGAGAVQVVALLQQAAERVRRLGDDRVIAGDHDLPQLRGGAVQVAAAPLSGRRFEPLGPR
ncbi:hypothetical protein ACFQHO_12255 [Actinomadura yumaensis]|uniref:hypothetical protein n=1 Tax=Actinomadura yumaensis TaxID=111807 RepID=UPI003606E126